MEELRATVGAELRAVIDEVKPRLRGWLHAVVSPLALVAGIVLVLLSPTPASRIGSAVFAVTAMLLFTVSAIYHRGTWSRRTWAALQRFDHANIYLLIAGSYTPFTLLLLDGTSRVVLLSLVWVVAVLGVAARLLLPEAPRWVQPTVYIALGWAALPFAGEFLSAGSLLVLGLVATGGVLYTIGGLVYGLQRPNPWPTWFGFHEVFHSFTVVAFLSHYAGVLVATATLA